MSLAQESETIIRFDESATTAIVYTSSPRVAKHMEKAYKPYKTYKREGKITGWEFKVPKSMIRIATKVKTETGVRAGKSLRIGGTV